MKSVVINVQKKEEGPSFATVMYDSGRGLQSPLNMDKETQGFANNISHKTKYDKDDIIYLDTRINQEKKFLPGFSDIFNDFNYCIYGAEDKNINTLMNVLYSGVKNQDIDAKLFITNGEQVLDISSRELMAKGYDKLIDLAKSSSNELSDMFADKTKPQPRLQRLR